MRSTYIFLVLFFVFSTSAAVAQNSELDTLIRNARAAVGREQDLAKIKSIHAEADCEGPLGKYTTNVTSFGGDKSRFEQQFTYKPDWPVTLVNGSITWTVDRGQISMASPFARMAARSHEYQKMACDFRRYFSGLEMAGDADFAGDGSLAWK